MLEKKKYFKFNIDFETEEDRDNFKNYVHHIKTGKGIPIYRTAINMMELHKRKKEYHEILMNLNRGRITVSQALELLTGE